MALTVTRYIENNRENNSLYFCHLTKINNLGADSRHYGNRHFGTVDIMGIDILGIDIIGVDILGIDILALHRQKN